MGVYDENLAYIPGTYPRKRPGAHELATQYIREWDEKRLELKGRPLDTEPVPPTVCFSRKIGVGALEVADLLAEMTAYQVVDREILEHIAREAKLKETTVALFDERYPGKLRELLAMAFGEKSFTHFDYSKHLFSTVIAIACLRPTIFVGRGCHLVLPRHRVLAVRFVLSRDRRIQRLIDILAAKEKDVEQTLDRLDREQRDFFKRVFGREDAPASEFDMVVNLDYITEPEQAAGLVALAFAQKFGLQMDRK